ncbi:L-Aspartase-like protein [Ampelomyces quisqualis]|uniref:L-Aspartase-like protein n=1 Tax=Ampelomyces quisqualis TaxID=50730 RepID=A0A6A5QCJ2_AMPQU|nr:L-Aspartase-like protein [Ampelomyces quisqualis]
MAGSHLAIVLNAAERLEKHLQGQPWEIDGNTLQIADVVASAFHDRVPEITDREDVIQNLQDSVAVLMDHLAKGNYVYGVNTGFGGSADSRTTEVVSLQAALMQLTQAGVLTKKYRDGKPQRPDEAMPSAWVRATMVVRCNTTLRGHSAVSLPVLRALQQLLKRGLVPIVPLRGSVSASGDLMPLAYIVGTMEGSPSILVQSGDDEKKSNNILPANLALAEAGLEPIVLGPKEGLGLVNGTAASAALGALVVHKSHQLAVLVQALTGVAVEALRGCSESFNPFIAAVRPNSGQVECARNILSLLQGSRLARDVFAPKDRRREDLLQDRYCLRSTSQWVGPYLEDLILADRQITVELNSSCDNPLVNVESGDILYNCNFQAVAVTTAVEKTRLALQMFGRLITAQFTEMVDPSLSRGLPANLVADNPSLSFGVKGVDISMAAYLAELSYLAGPMSSHIQPTEMSNQAVNSMAFASARMSMHAVDVLSMMCACSLYAGCQALDLRVLHETFLQRLGAAIHPITDQHFGQVIPLEERQRIHTKLQQEFIRSWNSTSNLDVQPRCRALVLSALPTLTDALPTGTDVAVLASWKDAALKIITDSWTQISGNFFDRQPTEGFLGAGSRVLYHTVRHDLGVPFQLGFIEHPTIGSDELRGRPKRTVGEWISVIYEAIKEGSLFNPLFNLMKEGGMEVEKRTGRLKAWRL